MRFSWTLLLILIATGAEWVKAQPTAPLKEFVQIWHGRKFLDSYYWLRDKGAPAVEEYLRAENAYTESQSVGLKPFQETLYAEMLSRIKQDDMTAPVRDGSYYYYSRTQEGQQYPIFCRRKARGDRGYSDKSPEEILLDQNAMAKGLKFLSIGVRRVSDNERYLLYSVDSLGFRQYDLFVKDLVSGEVKGPLGSRVTSAAWAADNKTFFYVTEDPTTKRSDTLWRSQINGTSKTVFFEKDELFSVRVGRTKDKRYVLRQSLSTDTWDTQMLSAFEPTKPFINILPRRKGHKYDVEHRNGYLFLRTNDDAKNFRLVSTPLHDTSVKSWKEILPNRADVLLDDFEVFKDFLVVEEKSKGLNRIRAKAFGDDQWKDISFPEPVYQAALSGTPSFDSKTVRYQYQSFITPPSTYQYNVSSAKSELVKQETVLGGYDPQAYASERLWAKARDGVLVPVSLHYKKGTVKNGQAPLWLYGYGSYGSGLSATFDARRLSLLDRGVVYAIAHVRGGNELGEAWHDDGMLMKKKNSFFDYVDVASFLIKEKWTAKGKILAEGASAGGLLMGAVVNMRPDLWGSVHAGVPFVDVMNTMMDASLPLTVGEYLEWGNPNEKAAFDYMLSYSPYDNLKKGHYPPILVTTSYNDSQVMYWEPAKYVAKLRAMKTDKTPLIFKIKMEPAGHGGASGRYDALRDRAFEYAWMLSQVGIKK